MGFARQRASNEKNTVENSDLWCFCSPYLPNVDIQRHNYYAVIFSLWLYNDIELYDLESP